ncbi:MAG TPA: Uma2 family endonuclease [Candidatus Eisenbacteria bacterium]|nr:Uma2 family endonuclease [Candidatus Eisenbacteria bacterium]
MAAPAPAEQGTPGRYTVAQYADLVRQGVLGPDDRVELLDGVIVAVAPQNPWHAAVLDQVKNVLASVVGDRATVRVQSPLALGPRSMPEPDVAVVAGRSLDFVVAHPTSALLVAECADASVQQDRLTKAAIYAAAGIPEYWIVSRRDDAVEVFRDPDPAAATYRTRRLARRGERLAPVAITGAGVAVDDLLPAPADSA